ncbi:hypothetical protein [Ornithinibacillus xuwenensis]|uniref:HeH/LEM domain-containing protein n=1 Tax=Ornithinibacillus xuwenensis TaxID=3144668 RepID=A0ABU9XFA0_9BACI
MIFKGSGLVWDKENKKILCRFEDGEYNTDVKREQIILKELGFLHEEEEAKDPVDLSGMDAKDLKKINKDDIKEYLDEQKIEYESNANKDELIALIVGEQDGQE